MGGGRGDGGEWEEEGGMGVSGRRKGGGDGVEQTTVTVTHQWMWGVSVVSISAIRTSSGHTSSGKSSSLLSPSK